MPSIAKKSLIIQEVIRPGPNMIQTVWTARKERSSWRGTGCNAVFDFQEDLLKYCKSDVKLLKDGWLKFVREFEDIAGFNPLIQSITIASACNHFWHKENWKKTSSLSSL